jgi:hypothetical protein
MEDIPMLMPGKWPGFEMLQSMLKQFESRSHIERKGKETQSEHSNVSWSIFDGPHEELIIPQQRAATKLADTV